MRLPFNEAIAQFEKTVDEFSEALPEREPLPSEWAYIHDLIGHVHSSILDVSHASAWTSVDAYLPSFQESVTGLIRNTEMFLGSYPMDSLQTQIEFVKMVYQNIITNYNEGLETKICIHAQFLTH